MQSSPYWPFVLFISMGLQIHMISKPKIHAFIEKLMVTAMIVGLFSYHIAAMDGVNHPINPSSCPWSNLATAGKIALGSHLRQ
ncbi:MAG: hypothetical protein IPK94_06210 [Saprospiraceae bacterium]|nr:hypothetical protein [Saprospiraceae bacterium]